jgi:hypothetical protein
MTDPAMWVLRCCICDDPVYAETEEGLDEAMDVHNREAHSGEGEPAS